MPIPPVSQFRIPLLTLLGDGKSRHLQEAATGLADVFNLTDEERAAHLASGYPIVRHRTGWAGFHLRKADLVEDGQKGILKITDEGEPSWQAIRPAWLIQFSSSSQNTLLGGMPFPRWVRKPSR